MMSGLVFQWLLSGCLIAVTVVGVFAFFVLSRPLSEGKVWKALVILVGAEIATAIVIFLAAGRFGPAGSMLTIWSAGAGLLTANFIVGGCIACRYRSWAFALFALANMLLLGSIIYQANTI